jgi:glyceraldehyde-3-phosphate dehydrogenase [NAD(P)+]
VPAILAGNTVVAKAASDTPLSLLLLGRAFEEAGIPHGVFNVITGRGDEIGDALVSDPRVRGVTFTGSTLVGKHLASVANVRKQHLELGGKGMAIVLDDADLRLAATKCVQGSLSNAGQRCDAISAILVVGSVADEFTNLVLCEVDGWKLGDPRDPATKVGPVINEAAARRIKSLVDDAIARGASLLAGGDHSGCYFQPTVIANVPVESSIVNEETFGPVVTIVKVSDEDEALVVANGTRYGLDSCVFSSNFYRIWKIAKRLNVGGVAVNDFPRHGVGFFPFGGWKDSGVGREGIGYSIEEMTSLKTITFNLEPAKLGKTWQSFS